MPTPLPNPFADDLDAAAKAMRDDLASEDPIIRHRAARSITWAANIIQRTNAYLERCQILNERTRSTPYRDHSRPSPTGEMSRGFASDREGMPEVGSSNSSCHSSTYASASDNPNSRNSSAPSANSAVNTPWQDYYRDLPPGSINPWNGEVVPEEHISQIPPEFNDKEAISFLMFPGPKTKADLYRGISALLNHNEQIYHEHNALKAEVRVFRSERLGSITTEKREELLAERYESNKRQRENKPVPFFIKDLTPDEIANLIKREPHPPEIIDVGLPRTHDFDNERFPSSPSGRGQVRASAFPTHSSNSDSARLPHPPSPTATPSSASISSPQDSSPKTQDSPSPYTNSPPSSASSAHSAVNDLPPGHTRDADGNILSPRAAARRANPNRYIFKPKPLIHPHHARAPNSS